MSELVGERSFGCPLAQARGLIRGINGQRLDLVSVHGHMHGHIAAETLFGRLKGVPVRLAIGHRDLENGTCEVCRRDTLEKLTMSLEGIADHVEQLMDEIQRGLFQRAVDYRAANTRKVDSWDDFLTEIEKGGFLLCHWDGTTETEEKIKELTKATIRCIPNDAPAEEGKCILTGKPSHRRVIFARSY